MACILKNVQSQMVFHRGLFWTYCFLALYLNDLNTHIKSCRIIHYADDTVIYYGGKTLEDIESNLSSDFTALSEYCIDNELILNLKKKQN